MGSNSREFAGRVAAVVIGRNEGARLEASLRSLEGQVGRIIYVDSGSTDGSLEVASRLGAQIINLDLARPFTAARSRNAGLHALASAPPDYVQFLDGDCLLQPGWLAEAVPYLDAHPQCAAAAGRRREMFPERSIYNRLCDVEWDTPVGPTRAVGGDSLVRYTAILEVGGFRESLIAGEEPEMCVRLRAKGWQIRRLDVEMTRHDAALVRFGQWWRRSRRAGFAFAEGAALHGAPPENHWTSETRRALIWGAGLPALSLGAALAHPAALILLMAYPLKLLRLLPRMGLAEAGFSVIGKFAEASGAIEYYLRRMTRRKATLIEYK